jgi:ABC-2 type transport system permease protein
VNKTLLVLKHEFAAMLKRKGYIILTLAFPLLALAAIGVFQIIENTEQPPAEVTNIGYVDEVGIFSSYTEHYLTVLMPFTTTEEATEALLDDAISEYFIIPLDYVESGIVKRFTLERELEPPGETIAAIRDFLQSNLLEGQASQEISNRVKFPMALFNTVLDEAGQPTDDVGGIAVFILPYLFSLLLLMAIFTSSGYVLQGLGEEKENRIMEILLSSISARQLITGKVLGLGAAGILQMVFWLLSARLLIDLLPSSVSDVIGNLEIAPDFIILSLIYFILGYLLFAILMAGIGSIGATARESQQLAMVIIIPAALPLYAIYFVIENPQHIISQLLTYFPFSAPITVIMRLGIAEIPIWQLAISMAILVASIYFSLILVAKAFRTFLLMYGKTPKLGEIIKLLRQA